VADGDDRAFGALEGGQELLRHGAGREPVVDGHLGARCDPDRARRLACPEEGARHDPRGFDLDEPLGQLARLRPAARAQRPQLVGVTGIGMRVPDEEEAHEDGG
jgi:hypothetical protein